MYDCSRKSLCGFSLIEVSMVLLIFGIIAAGMLKGRDIIENARISSVANDIQVVQTVFESYVNSYGSLPGDDANATKKFQGVENGDGDGSISQEDAKKLFSHLFASGLIDSPSFKKPKIGGKYDVVSEDGIAKLRISNDGRGSLSDKQALKLFAKINEILGENSNLVQIDPPITGDSDMKYVLKVIIGNS